MSQLIAPFERSTGHKVRSDFDGAIGEMTERLRKGEAARRGDRLGRADRPLDA
jgi:hypothetical protein